MPNEKGSSAGKVAFVTGAANGIRRAAALAFARLHGTSCSEGAFVTWMRRAGDKECTDGHADIGLRARG